MHVHVHYAVMVRARNYCCCIGVRLSDAGHLRGTYMWWVYICVLISKRLLTCNNNMSLDSFASEDYGSWLSNVTKGASLAANLTGSIFLRGCCHIQLK